jgi:hypothetical protein
MDKPGARAWEPQAPTLLFLLKGKRGQTHFPKVGLVPGLRLVCAERNGASLWSLTRNPSAGNVVELCASLIAIA